MLLILVGCASMDGGREGRTSALEWQGRIYGVYGGDPREVSREPVPFASAMMTRLATGQTQVTLSLNGGSTAVTYSWRIHEGTCGSSGPMLGRPEDYGPLEVDWQGVASAILDLKLDPGKAYSVRLYHDETGAGGCGDLMPSQTRRPRTRPLRAAPVLGFHVQPRDVQPRRET